MLCQYPASFWEQALQPVPYELGITAMIVWGGRRCSASDECLAVMEKNDCNDPKAIGRVIAAAEKTARRIIRLL